MKKGYLKPSLTSIDMEFEGVIASSFTGSGGEPEEGGSGGSSGGGGIIVKSKWFEKRNFPKRSIFAV